MMRALSMFEHRRWIAATACVWLLAVAAFLLLLRVGGEEASVESSHFDGTWPTYTSIDELISVSDVTVIGTVEDILQGEIAAAGTEEEVSHLNIVVNVDDVLSGSVTEATVTVKTLELSYGGPDFADWRTTGEQVVLFLTPSEEEPGLYIPANTNYAQTVYSIQDDELDPVMEDPLSEEIGSLSLSQFVTQFSPRR